MSDSAEQQFFVTYYRAGGCVARRLATPEEEAELRAKAQELAAPVAVTHADKEMSAEELLTWLANQVEQAEKGGSV